MTDVVALRGRGAFLSAPFRNSISRACRPTMRSNAAILDSVFLEQLGCLGVFIQAAGFILLNPHADQLARNVVPLGERV